MIIQNGAGIGIGIDRTFASAGGAYSYLLDDISGAEAAYSMFLLRSAYAGSAIIRLRRSSDNAELNFTNNANNVVAMDSPDVGVSTTMSAWVGANSAFMVTTFDQTIGGHHQSQSAAGQQRQVVNAGVLNTENGVACANSTDAVTRFHLVSSTIAISGQAQPFACHSILTPIASTGSSQRIVNWDNSSAIAFAYNNTPTYMTSFGSNLTHGTSLTYGTQYMSWHLASGANSEAGMNGSVTTGNAGTNAAGTTAFGILGMTGSGQWAHCKFQEIVVWGTPPTRATLEAQVNARPQWTVPIF